MPKISFVTVCKGRLDQLRRTLPHLIRQPACECVVVDFACPEGTHRWVAEHFPQVQIVCISHDRPFNLSHGRNIGGQRAQGDWLCFIDADAEIREDMFLFGEQTISPGNFYLFSVNWPGLVTCHAQDFKALNGYDETFQGWGCADNDFLTRLVRMGRKPVLFPSSGITRIDHGDDLRTVYYPVTDKMLSWRINALYLHIKTNLAKYYDVLELPRDELRPIYGEIKRASLAAGHGPVEIKIKLPLFTYSGQPPGWSLHQEWIFRFQPHENLHS